MDSTGFMFYIELMSENFFIKCSNFYYLNNNRYVLSV